MYFATKSSVISRYEQFTKHQTPFMDGMIESLDILLKT